ncbi:cysteine-rich receptor-like protein kinase 10, partial [Populus trichocarpa]|uniref:cysteine-rich receptor-like protein kinase 10 n=1 Tax=Populus trichocarpa TaxID=3694 RepID=UPI0022789C14
FAHPYSTGHDVNEVYGLFLCRGDVSVKVCLECVNLLRNEVVQRCPIQKEAIIYYDLCFLRYSNSNIFSRFSQTSWVVLLNTQNIAVDVQFNKRVNDSISDAAKEAARAPSGEKKFAAKKVIYTWEESLYVLVQCTPDLSKYDCNRCLNLTISYISVWSKNAQGGRVLFPSCNSRFEIYSFYNETAVVPLPPPPLSPPPLSPPVVPLPPSPGSIADGKGSIFFFIIPKSFFIISLI